MGGGGTSAPTDPTAQQGLDAANAAFGNFDPANPNEGGGGFNADVTQNAAEGGVVGGTGFGTTGFGGTAGFGDQGAGTTAQTPTAADQGPTAATALGVDAPVGSGAGLGFGLETSATGGGGGPTASLDLGDQFSSLSNQPLSSLNVGLSGGAGGIDQGAFGAPGTGPFTATFGSPASIVAGDFAALGANNPANPAGGQPAGPVSIGGPNSPLAGEAGAFAGTGKDAAPTVGGGTTDIGLPGGTPSLLAPGFQPTVSDAGPTTGLNPAGTGGGIGFNTPPNDVTVQGGAGSTLAPGGGSSLDAQTAGLSSVSGLGGFEGSDISSLGEPPGGGGRGGFGGPQGIFGSEGHILTVGSGGLETGAASTGYLQSVGLTNPSTTDVNNFMATSQSMLGNVMQQYAAQGVQVEMGTPQFQAILDQVSRQAAQLVAANRGG